MALPRAAILERHWPGHPGPVLDWLIGPARRSQDGAELLLGLCRRLVEAGVPLARASFHIRTLHPQLFGMGFYWQRGRDDIQIVRAEHGIEQTDTFLKSPMHALFEGAGAVRQRLDLAGATYVFPLFEELRDQGLTDYVALPITFSDGKTHGTTWSSDRPGGFAGGHLSVIEDLLPLFTLLLEVHLARLSAITLLDTYVGHHAGERILKGQITRGSGETVRAAVWISDLRGFTAMSERRSRDQLLACLNDYFDCVAGAVDRHGGEILKFIGDAMLAVFPLDHEMACWRAVQAAVDARHAIDALNTARSESGAEILDCGIALHAGEVMYGNIGAKGRLDFTVIGPAVNLAARIESKCRELGPTILVSDDFAGLCSRATFRSLGRHHFAGIDRSVEILTVVDPA